MNYEFLDGFNLFLQTAHRCRHNGAVAVMNCLRNFVLYCLRNEWITKNPFRYYKLKEDEVQAKEHLTCLLYTSTAVRLSQFPHQPKTTNLNEP